MRWREACECGDDRHKHTAGKEDLYSTVHEL
jgi:hypothetical protein